MNVMTIDQVDQQEQGSIEQTINSSLVLSKMNSREEEYKQIKIDKDDQYIERTISNIPSEYAPLQSFQPQEVQNDSNINSSQNPPETTNQMAESIVISSKNLVNGVALHQENFNQNNIYQQQQQQQQQQQTGQIESQIFLAQEQERDRHTSVNYLLQNGVPKIGPNGQHAGVTQIKNQHDQQQQIKYMSQQNQLNQEKQFMVEQQIQLNQLAQQSEKGMTSNTKKMFQSMAMQSQIFQHEAIRIGLTSDDIKSTINKDRIYDMLVNKFQEVQEIGQGSFGVVYKVKTPQGFIRALKMQIVKNNQMEIDNEVKLVQLLSSEGTENLCCNNIMIYDTRVVSDSESQYRVEIIEMELADTSLRNLINEYADHKDPENLEAKFKDICPQLICNVLFMHNNCVVHRDLKMDNILVSNGFYVLADFGEAFEISDLCATQQQQKKQQMEQFNGSGVGAVSSATPVSAKKLNQLQQQQQKQTTPENSQKKQQKIILKPGTDTFCLRQKISGSPLFFSPKLKAAFLSGRSEVVHDPFKSDIYSLGLVLLEIEMIRQGLRNGQPIAQVRQQIEEVFSNPNKTYEQACQCNINQYMTTKLQFYYQNQLYELPNILQSMLEIEEDDRISSVKLTLLLQLHKQILSNVIVPYTDVFQPFFQSINNVCTSSLNLKIQNSKQQETNNQQRKYCLLHYQFKSLIYEGEYTEHWSRKDDYVRSGFGILRKCPNGENCENHCKINVRSGKKPYQDHTPKQQLLQQAQQPQQQQTVLEKVKQEQNCQTNCIPSSKYQQEQIENQQNQFVTFTSTTAASLSSDSGSQTSSSSHADKTNDIDNEDEEIIYEGQWLNDVPNGQGKLRFFQNCWVYDGHFVNGMFNGYGEITFRGKKVFEGQWHNYCKLDFLKLKMDLTDHLLSGEVLFRQLYIQHASLQDYQSNPNDYQSEYSRLITIEQDKLKFFGLHLKSLKSKQLSKNFLNIVHPMLAEQLKQQFNITLQSQTSSTTASSINPPNSNGTHIQMNASEEIQRALQKTNYNKKIILIGKSGKISLLYPTLPYQQRSSSINSNNSSNTNLHCSISNFFHKCNTHQCFTQLTQTPNPVTSDQPIFFQSVIRQTSSPPIHSPQRHTLAVVTQCHSALEKSCPEQCSCVNIYSNAYQLPGQPMNSILQDSIDRQTMEILIDFMDDIKELSLENLNAEAAKFILHQLSFNPKFSNLQQLQGLSRVALEENELLKLLSTFLMSQNAKKLHTLDLSDFEKYNLHLMEIVDNSMTLENLHTILLRGRSYIVQREQLAFNSFFNNFCLQRITGLDFSNSELDNSQLLFMINSQNLISRLRRLNLANCKNLMFQQTPNSLEVLVKSSKIFQKLEILDLSCLLLQQDNNVFQGRQSSMSNGSGSIGGIDELQDEDTSQIGNNNQMQQPQSQIGNRLVQIFKNTFNKLKSPNKFFKLFCKESRFDSLKVLSLSNTGIKDSSILLLCQNPMFSHLEELSLSCCQQLSNKSLEYLFLAQSLNQQQSLQQQQQQPPLLQQLTLQQQSSASSSINASQSKVQSFTTNNFCINYTNNAGGDDLNFQSTQLRSLDISNTQLSLNISLKKKKVRLGLERLNVADCQIMMKNGRDFFSDEYVKNNLKCLVLDDQLFSYKEVRENLNGLMRLDLLVKRLDTFTDFTAFEQLNKNGVFINFTSRNFTGSALKKALADSVLEKSEIMEAQHQFDQSASKIKKQKSKYQRQHSNEDVKLEQSPPLSNNFLSTGKKRQAKRSADATDDLQDQQQQLQQEQTVQKRDIVKEKNKEKEEPSSTVQESIIYKVNQVKQEETQQNQEMEANTETDNGAVDNGENNNANNNYIQGSALQLRSPKNLRFSQIQVYQLNVSVNEEHFREFYPIYVKAKEVIKNVVVLQVPSKKLVQKKQRDKRLCNDIKNLFSSRSFEQIQTLDFSNSCISTEALKVLCNSRYAKKLELLCLSNNNVTDEDISLIANSTVLKALDEIRLNNCKHVTEKGINSLVSSANLRFLSRIEFRSRPVNLYLLQPFNKNIKILLLDIVIFDNTSVPANANAIQVWQKIIKDNQNHLTKIQINNFDNNIIDHFLNFVTQKNQIKIFQLKFSKVAESQNLQWSKQQINLFMGEVLDPCQDSHKQFAQITKLLTMMECLQDLQIDLANWQEMTDLEVSELMKALKVNEKNLIRLELSLEGWGCNSPQISNDSLKSISHQLSSFQKLNLIILNLSRWDQITDEGITYFFNQLTSISKFITYLTLHFNHSGSQLSNQSFYAIEKFFNQSKPRLHQLELMLDKWGYDNKKINDQSLITLSECFNNLKSLKNLTLSLSNYESNVGQKSITAISNAIARFQYLNNLNLNFGQWTEETEDGVQSNVCDNAVRALVHGISVNKDLSQLILNLDMWGSGNKKINEKGILDLSTAITQSKNLNNLELWLSLDNWIGIRAEQKQRFFNEMNGIQSMKPELIIKLEGQQQINQ